MTINVERNRLWVEALRSGKYRQGKGGMRVVPSDGASQWKAWNGDGATPPSHCCLGVATEVAIANGLTAPVWSRGNGYPTDDVIEWFGWGCSDPAVGVQGADEYVDDDGNPYEITASTANDNRGWTFEQIADGIEKYIIGETAKTDA